MGAGFGNELVGGQAALIRSAIKSPNYVPFASGWTINKTGFAEFHDLQINGQIAAGSLNLGNFGLTPQSATKIQFQGSSSSLLPDFPKKVQFIDNFNNTAMDLLNGPDTGFPPSGDSFIIPNGMVGSPLGGDPVITTTAATVATVAELNDAGIGAFTFTARKNRSYRIVYLARMRSTVASSTGDAIIRGAIGGLPAPGAGQILGRHSQPFPMTGGAGATGILVEALVTCSATSISPNAILPGTWSVGAYYLLTAGGGTIQMDQSTGGFRSFYVEDVG